ncbi:Vacuolar protein sorting-associated protein 45 [Venturia nashicola]|uniref:Vacuolar protein sorting-associated protein 45 n=1 Tax=Venturia nashicola TaxID=86259 RepID=A0A4Z1NJK0_9PEZI|nr:Vacuolar protein sorting-associated protein 45 [Venturia nashicola]TLD23470.1 Vacuolar protein sorting-associated protein 45 [Venturia nashicola]
MLVPIVLLQFIAASSARPSAPSDKSAQADLPTIKLPYGTWRASKYDAASDVYTFKNVRYAAPPVGNLRWAKPAPPAPNATLQTGEIGGTCWQSLPPSMLAVTMSGGLGGLGKPPSRAGFFSDLQNSIRTAAMPYLGSVLQNYPSAANQFASKIAKQDLGKLMGGEPSSEDCLFLDVYVPGKALKGGKKLPVVNWIYGGAFILGSKDGMYDGTPLVRQSEGNVIYVVGNYRLGAFGYLAGTTVERDATPNAGFHDQRAIFKWIRDNIHLVGGDKDDVSVWGESAGAGSIMHQLVAFGGTEPPLFKKAVIQSPANNPQHDRKGKLEDQFQEFATLAGCGGKGIQCLREASLESLRAAGDRIIASAPPGQYGFGPAVDGTLIRQLPDLEFASGNVQKGIESIIVTHVSDEATAFVADNLKTNKTFFESSLVHSYGNNKIIDAIVARYPAPGPGAKYKDEKARMADSMATGFFTCHVRTIANAFKDKAWIGQYSRGLGKHGMDLQANFYNSSGTPPRDDPGFATFAPTFQNYLLSHARTGDPNSLQKSGGAIQWPKATFGPVFSNVLEAGNKGFGLIDDSQTTADTCDFWLDVWASVTKLGGYVPPGGQVQTKIVS